MWLFVKRLSQKAIQGRPHAAWQTGENKSLQTKKRHRWYPLWHHIPECRRSVIPEWRAHHSKGPILG